MTRYKLRGYVREALTPEEDAIEAAHEEQSAIRREAEKVAEATRKAKVASGKAKLKELGLDDDELKQILGI